jgi:hypothetical protein
MVPNALSGIRVKIRPAARRYHGNASEDSIDDPEKAVSGTGKAMVANYVQMPCACSLRRSIRSGSAPENRNNIYGKQQLSDKIRPL